MPVQEALWTNLHVITLLDLEIGINLQITKSKHSTAGSVRLHESIQAEDSDWSARSDQRRLLLMSSNPAIRRDLFVRMPVSRNRQNTQAACCSQLSTHEVVLLIVYSLRLFDMKQATHSALAVEWRYIHLRKYKIDHEELSQIFYIDGI